MDPAFTSLFDNSKTPTFHSGAVFANRFFVIGNLVDADFNEIPAIWTSTNGLNWERANVPDPGFYSDLVAGPGALLAVGDPTQQNTPLWRTPNGDDWQRVASDFGGQRISRAGATDDGFVAFASAVWTSPDGVAWQESTSGSGLELASLGVQKVVRNGDQLAAFRGGASTGSAIELWTSTNLLDWTKVGELPHSRNVSSPLVAVGPLGWIVTGSIESDTGGDQAHRMWLSPDSVAWQEVTPAIGPISDVFIDETGYVAVGFLFIGLGCAIAAYEIQGLTWTSLDGQSWNEMTHDGFLYQRIDQLFRDGRTLFGLGLSYDENEGETASGSVWTARLPQIPPAGPGPTTAPTPSPEPGGCGPD